MAYLFGELDSTVSVLSYDETDGSFTELQKFLLYLLIMMRLMVVLRFVFLLITVSFMLQTVLHNSIAVYAVSENGEAIERIQLISTEGDIPRDFDLDPSEDFIVVANQDSDNLTFIVGTKKQAY